MAMYKVPVKRVEFADMFIEADSPEKALEYALFGIYDDIEMDEGFNSQVDWEVCEGCEITREDDDEEDEDDDGE